MALLAVRRHPRPRRHTEHNGDQPDHLEIVDVVRDDTFTVLFQKNGVRYVVVTLADDEAWLTEILTTWQFTD